MNILYRIIILFLIVNFRSGFGQCAAKPNHLSRYRIVDSSVVDIATRTHLDDLKSKIVEYIGFDFSYKFYDDTNAPNALAFERGEIYIGVKLIEQCLNRPEGLLSLDFIFAHEVSHLFQFRDVQNRLRDKPTMKYFELQADCLGSKIIYDVLELRDANRFKIMLDYVFEIGDYQFTNYQHHGTPFERYIAYFVYWNLFSKDVNELYKKSYYLFSRQSCQDCHPISHYNIIIKDENFDGRYSLGLDLNIYNGMSDGGFGKPNHIKGRLLPNQKSKIDQFTIKIYKPKLLFLRRSKKYYIRKKKVFSDKEYENAVGTI